MTGQLSNKYLSLSIAACHALIISKQVMVELQGKIGAMFKRLRRYGYINDNLTLSGLLDKADCNLFSNMCRPKHYLHHVLPPLLRMVDNLRVRGHVYNLPECSTSAHKKSFVVRSLYNFI